MNIELNNINNQYEAIVFEYGKCFYGYGVTIESAIFDAIEVCEACKIAFSAEVFGQ